MNNGYQKFNGFEKTKEGWEFFKTFFYPNAQSKHVRPLAYNSGITASPTPRMWREIERKMETIYFQPPGIKPEYCEAGMISETDPNYIWYLDEPCKILISEVRIIPKENVVFNQKSRLIRVVTNPANRDGV